ncbi:unnamed protein product [Leptosia nina]|uniref:ATP synthase protein MI25 n=1 Tax=Leptosia nina TaxID=320188 RepID=A0AAV1J8C4_9NEOP
MRMQVYFWKNISYRNCLDLRLTTAWDKMWIERIILKLADMYNIQLIWDRESAFITGTCAIIGGIIGGYMRGQSGAILGASTAGLSGFGVSKVVSLRKIWESIRTRLEELIYIVLNYLRSIDPVDYVQAFRALMACTSSRRELAYMILNFIADKLETRVLSSLTAA